LSLCKHTMSTDIKIRKTSSKIICFLGIRSRKFFYNLAKIYGEPIENKIYLISYPFDKQNVKIRKELYEDMLEYNNYKNLYYLYYPRNNMYINETNNIDLTSWFPDPAVYAVGFPINFAEFQYKIRKKQNWASMITEIRSVKIPVSGILRQSVESDKRMKEHLDIERSCFTRIASK